MAEAEGRVVLENGTLQAEVMRPEACAHCGACQHAHEQRRLYPLPEGAWKVGDRVTLYLPEHDAVPASLLAYGIPLAGLLIGLIGGAAVGLPEMGQAGAAIAGTAVGYLALKGLEPRLRASARFKYCLPCADKDKREEE